MRLGEAGDVERQRVGDRVQAARRHPHELRHRAVEAVAEPLARRTEVVAAGAAQQAVAADLRRRLADHAVPFTKPAHPRSDLGDRAAELVPEHDRDVHRPRMRVVRLVNVRAADRYSAHLQQNIALANLGNGDLPELDGMWFEGVMDDGGMRLHAPRNLSGNREVRWS